ncbi:hypothetical protein J2T18_001468 [Paenibacillus polymyxa]|uniref:hypothetical protein n=1 Tax=Paenibacillus polymyxa TaxID=1406 RepID=UPI00278D57A8|nr:hypothetical protein [Paenibacillus polymyxa]MDQ0047185.1 hypothetical protein [Paenibacillus polymyxa]
MFGRILVEVADLIAAEQEVNKLKALIQSNQLHVTTVRDSISDWRGNSADELGKQMNDFLRDLDRWVQQFESMQLELAHYTLKMKQADEQL